MSTARLVHALGPPLAYLVLAVVFTWPLSAHLTTALGSGLDPLLQTWVLAWDTHALITDPRTVWHAPIFFPYPETLAYSDHHLLLAMMTLPLIITGGPVLAYNLLVLTSYALTGWPSICWHATCWRARTICGCASSALLLLVRCLRLARIG